MLIHTLRVAQIFPQLPLLLRPQLLELLPPLQVHFRAHLLQRSVALCEASRPDGVYFSVTLCLVALPHFVKRLFQVLSLPFA